jgi:tetratricopeptide (TPR) repeat protein
MPDTTVVPLTEEIQRVAEQAMQLAHQHIDSGQFDQAAALYRAVLDMHPGHAGAEYQLGLLEWQAGRLPEAASRLSAAIQAAPAEASYWLAYIEVLLDGVELAAARETIDLGRRHGLRGNALDTLAQRLDRAEQGAPSRKDVDALSALMKQRRLDEAEHMARAMTVDCPNDPYGWKSLGVIHHMRGHIDPAVKAMAKAAECDHENAETYSNLGLLLKEARRHEDAIVCLQRALELDPKRADAHNNLAVTLLDMNRLAEAEASARASVAIDPKNALAWNTIGVALMGQSRMAGAVDAYRRVLKLEPDNAGVHSNMLFAMSQMEDIDAKALFAEHLRYAERVEAPLRKKWRAHANGRDPQRQMRIGFVSGDLRHHAVASFIEPIFERLAGRPGVALYAYHNHVLTDHVSERFKGYMAQWRDVVGLDDDALAQRIRDDGIDILVDLSGHTAHNRLPVFARKPAPLQATWIGYPGTTGLQAMDYYLTDRNILPPGQFDHQFTEKLVHLPVSAPFQPELDSAPINAAGADQRPHHLRQLQPHQQDRPQRGGDLGQAAARAAGFDAAAGRRAAGRRGRPDPGLAGGGRRGRRARAHPSALPAEGIPGTAQPGRHQPRRLPLLGRHHHPARAVDGRADADAGRRYRGWTPDHLHSRTYGTAAIHRARMPRISCARAWRSAPIWMGWRHMRATAARQVCAAVGRTS